MGIFVGKFGMNLIISFNISPAPCHLQRHAGKPCNMDAVALIGCAGDDFAKEHKVISFLFHSYMIVLP